MARQLALLLVALASVAVGAPVGTCPGGFEMNGYGHLELIPTGWGNPTAKYLDLTGSVQGIQPHMGSRGYFATSCNGSYANQQYLALDLLGKELSYTVDLSGAGCGCNVAFYLNSMNQNTKVSECFDYYCDANDVCGESCAEIDIQEANMFSWHTTLHTQFDHDGMGGGYGGGDGWNGPRDWTKAQYSPGGSCIDTMKPFQVSAAFPIDESGMLVALEVTLSQEGRDCPLKVRLSEYAGMADLTRALKQGMTPVVSYWSSDKMLWMDGQGTDRAGPCAADVPDECPEAGPKLGNFNLKEIAVVSNIESRHDKGRKVAHRHKHRDHPSPPQQLPKDTCPGSFDMPGYGHVHAVPTGWTDDSASNVEVSTDGVITSHMDSRAYLADMCTAGIYSNTQYLAMDLSGKSMLYTMDLSGAGCGCNAAMYLVSMRQNAQPSTCSDYYCDANSVCGVPCAEIDIQEANAYAWHSTLHTEYDHEGLGGGFGGGDGWNGPRDFVSWQYGPGAQCIDTNLPFQVNVSFPTTDTGMLEGMEVSLTQEGKSCSQPVFIRINQYKATGMAELSMAMKAGMTPVISYWSSSKMLWLDGNGVDHQGPCAVDEPAKCSESVVLSDFRVEPLLSAAPTTPEPTTDAGVEGSCVNDGQWHLDDECVTGFEYKNHHYEGCTSADAKSRWWCSKDPIYSGRSAYCQPCQVVVAGKGKEVVNNAVVDVPPTAEETQGPLAKAFEQCDGRGFAGNKNCEPGLVCQFMNEWWSQCKPMAEATHDCYEGWRPDKRCVKQFVYDDTEFTGCSLADSPTNKGWCSKAARYDGTWFRCDRCEVGGGEQINLQKKFGRQPTSRPVAAPALHDGPLVARLENIVVVSLAAVALIAGAIKVLQRRTRRHGVVRGLTAYEELSLIQQAPQEA